eukprot:TRINITY_DN611_c0_g2_i5.p1 TRINITY_DN611_c0_g2~~TRINITY_DN611_c0_g2_i5.p1  ORF type:complete len:1661 (+),score=168.82 TRINITY_DN611_c0_g2_i5:856-5838(+)
MDRNQEENKNDMEDSAEEDIEQEEPEPLLKEKVDEAISFQNEEIPKLTPVDSSKMQEVLKKLDSKFEFKSDSYLKCILGLFLGSSDHDKALKEIEKIKPKSNLCGKSLDHSDLFWMCDDCSKLGPCTCYCNECFESAKHKGHKYSFQVGNVGCCDCGDESSLKAESFCKAHSKISTPESDLLLLSDYQKVYSPLVLSHLMLRLHEALATADPTKEYSEAAANVQRVIMFLMAIFRISPLYHRFLADCLKLTFPGHITTHFCTAADKGEAKSHECTCNVTDNIMKYLLYLVKNNAVSEFIAELCKVHHNYGLAFLKSFWRNYKSILGLAKERQKNFDFLDKIMWQVIIVDQEIVDIVPEFLECYLSSLEWVVDTLVSTKGLVTNDKFTMCLNLYYDFEYFYNKEGILSDYLLRKTDFFPRLIKCLEKLQYLGHIVQLKSHILYDDVGLSVPLVRSIYFLTETFVFTLRSYALDDEILNKALFGHIFDSLLNDMKKSENKTMVNTANIPLLRAFGFILNKFIYLNPGMRPAEIKAYLQNLSGLDSVRFDEVLEHVLKRVLRVLGFITEVISDCWMYYSPTTHSLINFVLDVRKEGLMYVDIALVQILFSLRSEPSLDLLNLFEEGMMVPILDPTKTPLPHLSYKAPQKTEIELEFLPEEQEDASSNFKAAEETVLKSLSEKSTKLASQGITIMAMCLVNDIARPVVYLKSIMKGFKESPPPSLRQHVEYVLKKEATNLVLLTEEKSRPYEMFNLDNVVDAYPVFLKVTEAVEILRGYFKETRTVKGQIGYKVGPEFLNYANMFNMCHSRFLVNCELNLKAIQKLLGVEIDLFSERVIDKVVKGAKITFFEKMLSQPETAAKLIEIMGKMKDYMSHVVSLRLIYEMAHLMTNQWSEETKRKIINQLEQTLQIIDKIHEPSVEKVRVLLSGSGAKHSTTTSPTIEPKAVGGESDLKKKQQKIAEEFAKRQNAFKEKFSDELSKLSTTETEADTCSFCREALSVSEFDTKPFGYLCLTTATGIYKKAFATTLGKLVKEYPFLPALPIQNERSPTINTCSHLMHYNCFKEFRKTKNHTSISSCPLCKYPFNSFLPSLSKPSASAADLCKETIFPVESSADANPLQLSIDKLLNHIKGSCYGVDLNPLHSVISAKQKVYKLMFNCVFSFLLAGYTYKPMDVCTTDEVKCLALDPINVVLIDVIEHVLREAKNNGTYPADISEKYKETIKVVMNTYVYKACIKHLLVKHKGVLKKKYIEEGEVLKDLYDVAKNNQNEINDSIASLLEKLIFIQSVFDTWDYSDSSMDKMRNIITSTFETPERIDKYCQILGLDANPLLVVLNEIEATINKTSEKAQKALKFLEEPFSKGSERYIPTRMFYMQTTPLSLSLISLPNEYDAVFAEYYIKSCKHCNAKVKTKCLCLLCGEVICAAADCCRKPVNTPNGIKIRGELTAHALECGFGIGIFLHIYRGSLILQSDGIGVETTSIYINSFGEDISTFCNPTSVPFNSGDLHKYKLNMGRYNYLKDILVGCKEKYEIWQESQLGRPLINEMVQIAIILLSFTMHFHIDNGKTTTSPYQLFTIYFPILLPVFFQFTQRCFKQVGHFINRQGQLLIFHLQPLFLQITLHQLFLQVCDGFFHQCFFCFLQHRLQLQVFRVFVRFNHTQL